MAILKMSRETKQTVIGGALAGTVVGLESGLSWFVAGYPQFLKDKLTSALPRNGALLADGGGAVVGYTLKKKSHSAKTQNMANGVLFYDIPKLLDQFIYNLAYTMGTLTQGLGRRTFATAPIIIARPPMTNGVATTALTYPTSGAQKGKYVLKNSAPASMGGAVGRYR